MLTIISGSPGAGKSYLAVKRYVLSALQAGRKVITNIPMIAEEVEQVVPRGSYLIDQVDTSFGWQALDARVRRTVLEREHGRKCRLLEDGPEAVDCDCPATKVDLTRFDEWFHPHVPGMRALLVIDEAREWLHASEERVPLEIETLFSKHRHAGFECVLITQNMTDLYLPVRKLAAFNVHMKNLGALGFRAGYVASTCEGWQRKNTVGAAEWGRYSADVYRLYKSYSLGGANVAPVRRKRIFFRLRTVVVVLVVLAGLWAAGLVHVPHPTEVGRLGAAVSGGGKSDTAGAPGPLSLSGVGFARDVRQGEQAPATAGDVEAGEIDGRRRAVASSANLEADTGHLGHKAWGAVAASEPFEGGTLFVSALISVDGFEEPPEFVTWRSLDRSRSVRFRRDELEAAGFIFLRRGRRGWEVMKAGRVWPVAESVGR